MAVGMAAAAGGKEAAPMAPEQGPDLFTVGLRQRQGMDLVCREKTEAPLAMSRRHNLEAGSDLKEEHQPVRLPLVAGLAYQARQMQVGGLDLQADFLRRFPAGAGVRRFAHVGVQFAPARTP